MRSTVSFVVAGAIVACAAQGPSAPPIPQPTAIPVASPTLDASAVADAVAVGEPDAATVADAQPAPPPPIPTTFFVAPSPTRGECWRYDDHFVGAVGGYDCSGVTRSAALRCIAQAHREPRDAGADPEHGGLCGGPYYDCVYPSDCALLETHAEVTVSGDAPALRAALEPAVRRTLACVASRMSRCGTPIDGACEIKVHFGLPDGGAGTVVTQLQPTVPLDEASIVACITRELSTVRLSGAFASRTDIDVSVDFEKPETNILRWR